MRCEGALIAMTLIAGCSGSGRTLSPIRLEPLITLGASSGAGAIATTPSVSPRHPGGFRIVVPTSNAMAGLPLVFADDGQFLGNLNGDSSALGTFSGPMFTRFGPGDSIWVFDNAARVLVFNPQRQYVRTITLDSVPFDALVLADDRTIVTQRIGGVAELFDARGVLVRAIGTRDTSQRRALQTRMLMAGTNGSFWLSSRIGYWRLEHWDTAGKLLGVVEPHAEWFPADSLKDFDPAHRRDHPPPPRIAAQWIDGAGRLWIVERGRGPELERRIESSWNRRGGKRGSDRQRQVL